MRGNIKTAVSALTNKRFKTACINFSKHSKMRTEMINTVKKIVVDECKHIVEPSSKSILRRKALSNFHHSQVVTEMEEMCPVSLSLLSAMANYKNEIQKKIKLGNCFSVLMNTRNKNCNISQKVNSILMYKGKIRVKVCILHFQKKTFFSNDNI